MTPREYAKLCHEVYHELRAVGFNESQAAACVPSYAILLLKESVDAAAAERVEEVEVPKPVYLVCGECGCEPPYHKATCTSKG